MERLVSGTPFEQTASDMAAAYVAGYADGNTLLHLVGHDHSAAEPLERIHARYLGYIELEHPTPEARAYVAGFRDAAADNLPCPLHAIRSEDHKNAA